LEKKSAKFSETVQILCHPALFNAPAANASLSKPLSGPENRRKPVSKPEFYGILPNRRNFSPEKISSNFRELFSFPCVYGIQCRFGGHSKNFLQGEHT